LTRQSLVVLLKSVLWWPSRLIAFWQGKKPVSKQNDDTNPPALFSIFQIAPSDSYLWFLFDRTILGGSLLKFMLWWTLSRLPEVWFKRRQILFWQGKETVLRIYCMTPRAPGFLGWVHFFGTYNSNRSLFQKLIVAFMDPFDI
jgi:hypothetical protein